MTYMNPPCMLVPCVQDATGLEKRFTHRSKIILKIWRQAGGEAGGEGGGEGGGGGGWD